MVRNNNPISMVCPTDFDETEERPIGHREEEEEEQRLSSEEEEEEVAEEEAESSSGSESSGSEVEGKIGKKREESSEDEKPKKSKKNSSSKKNGSFESKIAEKIDSSYGSNAELSKKELSEQERRAKSMKLASKVLTKSLSKKKDNVASPLSNPIEEEIFLTFTGTPREFSASCSEDSKKSMTSIPLSRFLPASSHVLDMEIASHKNDFPFSIGFRPDGIKDEFVRSKTITEFARHFSAIVPRHTPFTVNINRKIFEQKISKEAEEWFAAHPNDDHETVLQGIKSSTVDGVDMSLIPLKSPVAKYILEVMKESKVPKKDINKMIASNILLIPEALATKLGNTVSELFKTNKPTTRANEVVFKIERASVDHSDPKAWENLEEIGQRKESKVLDQMLDTQYTFHIGVKVKYVPPMSGA